jgi:hypothetical protein
MLTTSTSPSQAKKESPVEFLGFIGCAVASRGFCHALIIRP